MATKKATKVVKKTAEQTTQEQPKRFSKLWEASLKTQGWITVYDPNLM
ncbi:MAG: hypothetical protein J6V13_05040 [Paludibacteraceae bacterium]|nr:hypothetical protein [Paludibacteraceae bacterium]